MNLLIVTKTSLQAVASTRDTGHSWDLHRVNALVLLSRKCEDIRKCQNIRTLSLGINGIISSIIHPCHFKPERATSNVYETEPNIPERKSGELI
jgi:hypothetical protein